MSDSGASYIETLEIEQRKLSRTSNGHKLSHGGPIQGHHISRRSKLNSGSSRQFKIVITFHSDVRSGTSDIETLEIKKRNRSRHSNGYNFSHGGPIQVRHISRRSKLNNEISREIKMVISYNTEVRFRNITYRDARN